MNSCKKVTTCASDRRAMAHRVGRGSYRRLWTISLTLNARSGRERRPEKLANKLTQRRICKPIIREVPTLVVMTMTGTTSP